MSGKTSGLSGVSTVDLKREIERRKRHAGKSVARLQSRRDRLLGQLADIEAQLREAGIQGGKTSRALRLVGGTRLRHKNDTNLADALAKLLSDQTLNVTGAAEAVQKAGYKTTSPNFRTIVNQTLIKDRRFKRTGRGLYTVKAAA